MKRVKFVSGFNAKMALVACAVAGFTLTGCEKEEFTVDVPNIEVTVPEVNFPTSQDGLVYLTLSATSNTGESLVDVTYTLEGEPVTTYNVDVTKHKGNNVTIEASCTGYYTNTVTVAIPNPPKDQIITVPVNVVLEKVELAEGDVVTDVDVNNPVSTEQEKKNTNVPAPAGGFQPNTEYTASVAVPDATPYMSAEQKTALYAAVDALEGPVTKAAGDDLEIAKDMLRAQIRAYNSSASMNGQVTVNFTVTEQASSVTLTVTTTANIVKVVLTATVNNADYQVEGECTVPAASTVTAEAEGVDVSHSHDHGDNPNAGGGTFGD